MQKIPLDTYIIDVLMPDLVGHDRRPAAFLVYLFLLRQAARTRRDQVPVSLQAIATQTGLAKSTVQAALRHLRRRRLLDPEVAASSVLPVRAILRPWTHHS
jgi:CRP-like cAMP-binding protein